MIRRPPRSTLDRSSAASDVYKRQPLGGAKPKALIDIDGEQWVIKFFNNEYVDAPLIEHATMTLAAQAGINLSLIHISEPTRPY